MLPEHHLWKPAVQAATVMLKTPPVHGQSLARQPHPLPIYSTQFWERPPSPTSKVRRHRWTFALCRHIAGWTQACN